MAPIPNALQAGSPSTARPKQTANANANANANAIRLSEKTTSPNDGSPLPSRLTRSDLAAFLPFVRDLDILEQSDLSARLARPRPRSSRNAQTYSQSRARNELSSRMETDSRDVNQEEQPDELSAEDEEDEECSKAGPSRIRRVDGPNFAPTYQDRSSSNGLPSKKRKRTGSSNTTTRRGMTRNIRGNSSPSPWDEREMNQWPVMASELHVEASDETLEESIESFASRYIRINNLSLALTRNQRASLGGDEVEDEREGQGISCSGQREGEDELDLDLDLDLEPELPEGLVSSAVEMVNRVLVGLAGCRPPGIGKKRKKMETFDWMGVLDVAGMIPLEVE
ncbi:hypothetical protein IAT40_004644 [Kwoniella sp. CBS 6097]